MRTCGQEVEQIKGKGWCEQQDVRARHASLQASRLAPQRRQAKAICRINYSMRCSRRRPSQERCG